GLTVGTVWWLGGRIWPSEVAAAVAVLADLVITGMLHVDGLCDAADGLLPHLEPSRRLEVMAAPDVGAFGVAALVAVLLLRFGAFSSTHPNPLLIGALWTASRTQMATVIVGVPYARHEGGLASAFLGGDPSRQLLAIAAGGTAVALALAALWHPLAGPLAVAAGTLAAAGVVVLACRRVGGFTGDVLGAAGMVGETVGLLVAAARW
ncbi:MAG TPA: adenosylcobinamide-GDP ribazoletransferase, partial [Acidimicrobiales bacterium]|nr:adenosylcobinamide-GDP ribazoletransferase [Acidimicrobiales bacterium]